MQKGIAVFVLFMVLQTPLTIFAQMPNPANMNSNLNSANALEDLKPNKQRKAAESKKAKVQLPSQAAAPRLDRKESRYFHPGILVNTGGEWQGSDHLLNLSDHIGVYVTLIKPEGERLSVEESQLKNEAERIFKEAGIAPFSLVSGEKPALPAFHIEIFVYPIERGYVAYCGGRLFESVILDRFKMDANMSFQAITWEKELLFVAPQEQFAEQLVEKISEIASTFGQRYAAYEAIKRKNF